MLRPNGDMLTSESPTPQPRRKAKPRGGRREPRCGRRLRNLTVRQSREPRCGRRLRNLAVRQSRKSRAENREVDADSGPPVVLKSQVIFLFAGSRMECRTPHSREWPETTIKHYPRRRVVGDHAFSISPSGADGWGQRGRPPCQASRRFACIRAVWIQKKRVS